MVALSTPWSRGKRPVISVVQSGGASVGRSVASAPWAPRRASRASTGEIGGSAARSGTPRPSIPTTKMRRDGCAASSRTGTAFTAGTGSGRSGERDGDRGSRREDRQHARERAVALGEEPEIDADRNQHRRGPAHHDGGEDERPQRLDRKRVTVGEQVGPVEPGHDRERHESEHGEEGATRDHGAARGRHQRSALPAAARSASARVPTAAHGRSRHSDQCQGFVAQPQRGVQVERERPERHGADRGHERRAQQHPSGHEN